MLGRRKLMNRVVWGLCVLALGLVVAPVLWILWSVLDNAVPHWRWDVLTKNQLGNGGGLRNAIQGTLLIMTGVLVLAGVVGVASGLYLAEYAKERSGQFLRGASEVLAGIPSIVLGYVGFEILVVQFHWGFSLLAALIVLSALVVPYIAKTTEVAVRNVPTSYREGGEALGMRPGLVTRALVLKPALPGILTGLIVAAAISIGETAPLLYTAGWSTQAPSLALTHSPVGYLTYATFTFYNLPNAASHQLANASALMLLVLVVLLIAASRVVVAVTQRHSPDRLQRLARRDRKPAERAPAA